MVVVKIELHPGGDPEKARPLGLVVISNDGTGSDEQGNYDVALAHSGKYYGKKGVYKRGKVRGFRRALSPYHLIKMALEAALQ